MDASVRMAEADGNRTRLTRIPGHTGFEDREGHQAPVRLHVTIPAHASPDASTMPTMSGIGTTSGIDTTAYRLTQFAHGGGCACKIAPGELEQILSGLTTVTSPDLLVGLEHGDDAAVFRVRDGLAVISTADFFTPVVDDAYDWGRIAAANALSDVYAMGGRPVVAVNLVGWPRAVLPIELLAEVLRGGSDVAREAACLVAGGHSIDDPEPKYGLAVTGVVDPERILRNDAARPGLPISLTKPLGVGML